MRDKISIVTSLYKSEKYINEFYTRTLNTLKELGCDYEFIFVNDGSPDDSLEVAVQVQEKDPNVKVVDLSRNFGHHQAIMTGLGLANGDYIFTLDSDLEEPPEELKRFYELIKQSEDLKSIDVVYGMRTERKDPFLISLLSKLFYWLFGMLTNLKNAKGNLFMRLMTKRYIQSVLKYTERNFFITGLFNIAGFVQVPLVVEKGYKGSTSYNFTRRLKLAINAITSFTSRPLYLIAVLGFFISALSFVQLIWIVYKKIFLGSAIAGWSSTIASIWFIGGVILLCMGVIGAYIAKIYEEVKGRPMTVIRKIYGE